MCGFAGMVDAERPVPRGIATAMANTVAYRGPDGFSSYDDDVCSLGFFRLAIVGGQSGSQPITASCRGSKTLVCNGEVFNHAELQRKLTARGHQFTGTSDCEVLLHLYEETQGRFLDDVRGQFAGAIWDSDERRLTLFRDRVGICPLYYATAGSSIRFGSEIKAVLHKYNASPEIDPIGVAQAAIVYGAVPPRTIFQGIEQLSPGCIATWHLTERGRPKVRSYWELAPSAPGGFTDRRETVVELQSLLARAVADRIPHRIPYATYLSGGLDSSAISALAAEHAHRPLVAASIAFDEPRFDESHYRALVADHLGLDTVVVKATRESIRASLHETIAHVEVPLARTAPVPLRQLAAAVADVGVKVALTGEGADELFFGYDDLRQDIDSPHQFAHQLKRWRRNSRALALLGDEYTADEIWFEVLDETELYVRQRCPTFDDISSRRRAQVVELATKLSGYLLAAQGDRVAMAHGVELRFPFLDERVVQFAFAAPEEWSCGTGKDLLREAAAPLLPAEVCLRPKQGYVAPDVSSGGADEATSTTSATLFSASLSILSRSGALDVARHA